MASKLENCILSLYNIGVVKFGEFILKSGMKSPVYFDLRTIVSYPDLLQCVSDLLWSAVPEIQRHNYKHVCGVAYTGIPLATVISQDQNIPMLLRRKEVKTYGTKKALEGVFQLGDSCLIIEDVLVSGASVYETVETLQKEGLAAVDAVVFLDREQGGVKSLSELGVSIRPVVTMTQMMNILVSHGKVSTDTVNQVLRFISTHNNTSIPAHGNGNADQENISNLTPTNPRLTINCSNRCNVAKHDLNKRLLRIIHEKCSNLCVAADVYTASKLLEIAEQVGPHICILKTHVDVVKNFTQVEASKLQDIACKHNFLLFEDSKFVDIGATVSRQYESRGAWADMVTAAPVLAGDGVLLGIQDAINKTTDGKQTSKGVVLVAEMSSQGALRSSEYVQACISMAKNFPSLVMGFVCQSDLTNDPGLLQFTPGVSLASSGDTMGQLYVSPKVAVEERAADVIIVGRAITGAGDVCATAEQYKQQAYSALVNRMQRKD